MLSVFQSDTLVSLLPISAKQSALSSVSTVKASSLPGQKLSSDRPTSTIQLVGPTTTELESFKELIQFDHVYFKPQPQSKTDLNGQTEALLNKLSKTSQVLLASGKPMKKVKVIASQDAIDIEMTSPCIQTSDVLPDSAENQNLSVGEEINIADINEDMLTDLNLDLLEDLESILKAESEDQSCSEVSDLQDQEGISDSIDSQAQRKGLKRKADKAEIDVVVDTHTPEVFITSHSSSDSGYDSDGVPSPYSAGSPSSVQEPFSPPLRDENFTGSLLADSTWEESFTQLFPDLM